MRKCKNCSKQRSKRKQRNSHTPEYKITEYGLAKIVSTPKIVVLNDQYMLEVLFKNQKKTKKLDKQVSKIKSQIKNLQRSIEKNNIESRNYRNSHDYGSIINQQVLAESKNAKSRTSSLSSTKNREIGRFTRVTEGQSQSFSKNSLKQSFPQSISNQTFKRIQPDILPLSKNSKRQQRSDAISFSEEANNYMLNFPKSPHRDNKVQKSKNPIFEKNSLLKYTTKTPKQQSVAPFQSVSFSKNQRVTETRNSHIIKKSEKNNLQMHIPPSYQQTQSSFSSNLLLSEESQQNQSQDGRRKREFEQLIILQKSAPQEDKKMIRSKIKALSKTLYTKD